VTDEANPLPGFMRRDLWAAKMNRTDFTAKRWQDKGKIVVAYFGHIPFVDLEATAARARGKDKRQSKRGPIQKTPEA
jgi:hypothetical protein